MISELADQMCSEKEFKDLKAFEELMTSLGHISEEYHSDIEYCRQKNIRKNVEDVEKFFFDLKNTRNSASLMFLQNFFVNFCSLMFIIKISN